MRCVILVHLVHRKATGKMLSSLEGKQSRERKKFATTVAWYAPSKVDTKKSKLL